MLPGETSVSLKGMLVTVTVTVPERAVSMLLEARAWMVYAPGARLIN